MQRLRETETKTQMNTGEQPQEQNSSWNGWLVSIMKMKHKNLALAGVFVFLFGLFALFNGVSVKPAQALEVSPGDGVLFYAASANTTPQHRFYTDSTNTFGANAGTVAGAQPTITVIKTSPTKQEAIAAYQDTGGNLRVLCYDGTTWTQDWTIAVAAAGTPTTRRFDIAYETTTGDVTVAYSRNAAAVNALAYRTKAGSSGCGSANWAAAANFPTTATATSGTVMWVKAARDGRAASNLNAWVWLDNAATNADLGGAIWSGTAFGQFKAIETSMEHVTAVGDTDNFDVQYESLSGDVMVVWGNSVGAATTNGARYMLCPGGTSSCTWGTATAIPTVANDATSLDLSTDPLSDKMAFASIGNAGADMQAAYWSGTAWTGYNDLDTTSEGPTAGTKLITTGWLTNNGTTKFYISFDDATGTGLSWWLATPGSTPVVQTDFASTPAINDIRSRYDTDVNPYDNSELIQTLSDSTNGIFAYKLSMNTAGTVSWSNMSSAVSWGTKPSTPQQGFHFQYWRYVPPITISGTSNGSGTVAVAVGSTLQAQTTTIAGGNWTISNVTKPSTNAVVTVWIDGVADASESTAITQYDGTGNITGMILDTNVVSMGSADNSTIDFGSLGAYGCSNDEDVMSQSISDTYRTEGNAAGCTNSYSDETLRILSGTTVTQTIDASQIITDNIIIEGTISISATFNPTIFVSGNWTDTGTFNPGFGIVRFTATSTGHTITTTGSSFYALTFDGVGGGWTFLDDVTTTNEMGITNGNLNGGSGTIITISSTAVNNFYNNGTFTYNTSTIRYTGNGASVQSSNMFNSSGGTNGYYNLEVVPAVNSGTAILAKAGSSIIGVANNLTIGNGTNTAVVVQATTHDPVITVAGNFIISANTTFNAPDVAKNITVGGNFSNSGTFNASASTVIFNDNTKTSVIAGSTTFNNFTVNTPGKNVNFTAGTFTTIAGALTVNGSSGNNVIFDSTSAAVWTIDDTTAGESITYLTVNWGACDPGSTVITMGVGSTKDANSGSCWTPPALIIISGTSNGTGTVAVAVGTTLQAQTTTISGGTWTITDVAKPTLNQVVTVWIDGAADASESTAVTKYDGTGDITGVVLNVNELTIGSNDNVSVSLPEMASYDCDQDEDIMHSRNIGDFLVQGCANAYADETITIKALNNFSPDSGDTITTDNIVILGSVTVSTDGLPVFNVSGNWTDTGDFDPQATSVNFTSTSTGQTIRTTGSPFYDITFNGVGGGWTLQDNIIVINNLTITNGNLNAGSTTLTLNGLGTSFVNNGTFTYGTSTVSYGAATSQNVATLNMSNSTGGTNGYYNLEIKPGSANVTHTIGTAAGQTLGVANNMTVGNGINTGVVVTVFGTTVTPANNPNIDVNGIFTINNNTTFVAPGSTKTFTVGDDFIKGATATVFTPNGGTVTLDSAAQATVSGSVTFYSLKIETPAKQIRFTAGETFALSSGGTLTITGTAGNLVDINSTTGNSAWTLNFPSGANSVVTYASVTYSSCTTSTPTISPTNSTNGGNNGACWVFAVDRTFSGTVQITSGAADGTVRNLKWSKNGGSSTVFQSTVTTGAFSFSSAATNGDIFHIWIDGETPKGTTVVKYGASCGGTPNCTGLALKDDGFYLYGYDTSPITNANLALCDSDNGAGCTDADLEFNVTGSNLSLSAGNDIHIIYGTYTPGGTVTTTSGSVSGGTGGNHVFLNCSTTLNMESNALSVGGNLSGCGAFNASAGQDTTFTATGAGFIAAPQSGTGLQDVILNGAGGSWGADISDVTIDGDLTVTAGTLSDADTNWIVDGGDVTGTGTGDINLTGGTFTLNGTGNFGGETTWDFYNLTFGSGSSGTTSATGTGSFNVQLASTVLTISTNHTLQAGSRTWRLGTGSSFVRNGTFTAQTSTFTYNIAGNANLPTATMTGANSFYIISINGLNGATVTAQSAIAANQYVQVVNGGALYMGAHDLTAGSTTSSSETVIAGGAGASTITQNSSATTTILGPNGSARCIAGSVASCTSLNPTGTYTFGNLVIGDGVNGFTLTHSANGITVSSNNLTVTTGSIFATTDDWTATGAVTGNGTINITGGTFINNTTTSQNFGGDSAWAFNNLTISGTGATAATGTGSVTVSGTLAVSSGGTLRAGNKTWILNGTGTPFSKPGTLDVSTGISTFSYRNTTSAIVTPANYDNLEFAPASGTPTYTLDSGLQFTINNNFVIAGAGNATVDASSAEELSVVGDVTIGSGDTLIGVGQPFSTSVGGSWTNNGTFTHNSGIVVFNATAAGRTITAGSTPFYSLIFSGVGGVWTLQDNPTISNVLTISNGNLDASSRTITLSGSGTPFVKSGGIFTQGTSTVNYTGGAATNVKDLNGASTTDAYYNLGLGTTSDVTSTTYAMAGSTTVNNVVTVSNAGSTGTDTLALGATTLTLKGAGTPLNLIAGKTALSAGTSTLNYTSSSGVVALSSVSTSGSNALTNLTINGSGNFNFGHYIEANGNLTVTAGTLAGANSLQVFGNVTGNGVINMASNTTFAAEGTNSFGGDTAWNFFNLELGQSATGATSAIGTGSITVNGNLSSFNDHILSAGSKTWILTGENPLSITLSSFIAQTSTFIYSGGTSSSATPLGYYNLSILPTANSITYNFNDGTLSVANNFVLGNGTNTGVIINATNPTLIIDLNGTGTSIDIKANTTFIAPSVNSFTVAGSWANAGTFTHNSGTVTFDATSTGKTIQSNGSSFNNITFNGSGGGWSPSDAMVLAGDLTMTAGTLSGTQDITVNGGDIGGAGVIDMTGGTVTIDGTGTFNNSSIWEFYNLNIGNGSGTETTSTSTVSGFNIDNVLTIATGHTLEAGVGVAKNWVFRALTGTPMVRNGTFTAGNSAFYFGASGGSGVNMPAADMTGVNKFSGLYARYSTVNAQNNIEANSFQMLLASTLNLGAHNFTLAGSTVFRISSDSTLTQNASATTTIVGPAADTTGCIGGSGASCAGAIGSVTLGNVVIGDGTTTFTNSIGGSNQSINMNSLNITANTTFNAGTASTINLIGNGTVLTPTGTFNAQTSTVNFNSAATTGTTIPALTYYNLSMNRASNTFTAAGAISANNLTVTAGTFIAPSGNLTVTNTLTNNGTFTHNSGTVVLTPASTGDIALINGASNTAFFNLTNTVAGTIVQFANGRTYSIDGTMTMTGTGGRPIRLHSDSPGVQWLVDFANTSNPLFFAYVRDAACSSSATLSSNQRLYDQGNNGTCWGFIRRGIAIGDGPSGGGSGSGGGTSGGGAGTGYATATATANMNAGSVSTITVTSGGNGYLITPSVTVCGVDGIGSGATATATISNGNVTSVSVTSGGSGYSSGAIVSIAAPGATAGGCGGTTGGGTGGGGGGSP